MRASSRRSSGAMPSAAPASAAAHHVAKAWQYAASGIVSNALNKPSRHSSGARRRHSSPAAAVKKREDRAHFAEFQAQFPANAAVCSGCP